MNQAEQREIACKHCGEVFASRGKYEHHYRCHHQNDIKVRSQTQQETTVTRSEDEKFICVCGKEYLVHSSLRRHQNSCNTWKDHEAGQDTDSHSEGNLITFSYCKT